MSAITQDTDGVTPPAQDSKTPVKVKKKRKIWNYKPALPVEHSPLFDWPPNPMKIAGFLKASYLSVSIKLFILAVALLSVAFFAPSVEITQTFEFGWVLGILVRNFILMIVIAGGLHLYFYTFAKQGTQLKFDARAMAKDSGTFKFRNQVWDNMYYSLVYGVIFWTFLEVSILWAQSNGYAPVATWSDSPVWFVLILFLIPIWHSFHFYWIHRVLHWEPLYKTAHSLHHKNVNIGPWSGMSMHPGESFFYLTSVLIHLFIPSSPLHVVYHLMYLIFNAVIGHSGFEALLVKDKPSVKMGRFYHWIPVC